MLADPSGAEHEVLGAIPYQRNEAVLHTDRSLLPRRRRAWASWNYHLLDEPVGRTHRHLPHEPPPVAATREQLCVTLNRTDGDRPGDGDPHDPLRPPGVHAGRRWRRRGAGTRSAASAARTTAAPTGATASTRTAWLARCGCASASGGRARDERSALYEGWVRHRRHEPVEHEFRYRIFMSYLDLDELPEVLDRVPLWSARRPAPAWFRGATSGRPSVPLRQAVRDAVEERTGRGPAARPAAHQRPHLGRLFNPVSFYYCFDPAGERVEALLAEVTNTPWGERHTYVLEPACDAHAVDKALPRLALPRHGRATTGCALTRARRRASACTSRAARDGPCAFDATLSLERRELRRLARCSRYPLHDRCGCGRHLLPGARASSSRAPPTTRTRPDDRAGRSQRRRSGASARAHRGRRGAGAGARSGRPTPRCARASDGARRRASGARSRGGTGARARPTPTGDWDCDDLVTLVRHRRAARCRGSTGCARAVRARCATRSRASRATRAAARDARRRALRPRQRPVRALPRRDHDLLVRACSTRRRRRCASAQERQARPRLPEARARRRTTTCSRSARAGARSPLHAAGRYGCRVTTTTISARAARLRAAASARRRARATRSRCSSTTTATCEGAFDKLVSIEMIEAVGWQYFDEYFRALLASCSSRTA